MIKSFNQYLRESSYIDFADELEIFRDYVDEFGSEETDLVEMTRPTTNGFHHHISECRGPSSQDILRIIVGSFVSSDSKIYKESPLSIAPKLYSDRHKILEFLGANFFPRVVSLGTHVRYSDAADSSMDYSSWVFIHLCKTPFAQEGDLDRLSKWVYLG